MDIEIDECKELIKRCKLEIERESLLNLLSEPITESYNQMIVRQHKEFEKTLFELATLRDGNGNIMSNETLASLKNMSYFDFLKFNQFMSEKTSKL